MQEGKRRDENAYCMVSQGKDKPLPPPKLVTLDSDMPGATPGTSEPIFDAKRRPSLVRFREEATVVHFIREEEQARDM